LISTQERPPRFTPSKKIPEKNPGLVPDGVPFSIRGLEPPVEPTRFRTHRSSVRHPLFSDDSAPVPAPEPRSSLAPPLNQVPDRLPLSTNADQYAPSPDATSLSATSACALAFLSTPLEKPLRRDRLPGFTQAVTRPSTLKTPPPTRYTPRASSSLTAPLRRTGRDSPEFAI